MKKTPVKKTAKKPRKSLPKGKAAPAPEAQGGACEDNSERLTEWNGFNREWVAEEYINNNEPYYFPTGNYPKAETIAGIASRLLEGDDFGMATRKALMLLAFAEEAIDEERSLREHVSTFRCVGYKLGVSEITRQKRMGRAEKCFHDFLAYQIEKQNPDLSPEQRPKKLTEKSEEYAKRGFQYPEEFMELKQEFADFWVSSKKNH